MGALGSQAAVLAAEHAIQFAPSKPLEGKNNKDNKVNAGKEEPAFSFTDYAKQLEDSICLTSTSVDIAPEQTSAPVNIYGAYRREEPDIAQTKENLKSEFPGTKNLNYLVAAFKRVKIAVICAILSSKGVTPEQIQTWQKESLQRADKQTTDLVAEMLGNIFLMKVIDPSKKGRKKEQVAEKALDKALKQLALYRGRNLSVVELLEMELTAQQDDILAKFQEERDHLAYQWKMEGTSKGLGQKITRLDGYISKAQGLMESNQKKLDQLIEKEQKKMFTIKTGRIGDKVYG